MPLGFALICFASCVCYYRFLGEFLPQTEFFYAVPTLVHRGLYRPLSVENTRQIAMCKAAKTVKTVFYVTKNLLISRLNASDQQSWTLTEEGINGVGSDPFININTTSKFNCQNYPFSRNMGLRSRRNATNYRQTFDTILW